MTRPEIYSIQEFMSNSDNNNSIAQLIKLFRSVGVLQTVVTYQSSPDIADVNFLSQIDDNPVFKSSSLAVIHHIGYDKSVFNTTKSSDYVTIAFRKENHSTVFFRTERKGCAFVYLRVDAFSDNWTLIMDRLKL